MTTDKKLPVALAGAAAAGGLLLFGLAVGRPRRRLQLLRREASLVKDDDFAEDDSEATASSSSSYDEEQQEEGGTDTDASSVSLDPPQAPPPPSPPNTTTSQPQANLRATISAPAYVRPGLTTAREVKIMDSSGAVVVVKLMTCMCFTRTEMRACAGARCDPANISRLPPIPPHASARVQARGSGLHISSSI